MLTKAGADGGAGSSDTSIRRPDSACCSSESSVKLVVSASFAVGETSTAAVDADGTGAGGLGAGSEKVNAPAAAPAACGYEKG